MRNTSIALAVIAAVALASVAFAAGWLERAGVVGLAAAAIGKEATPEPEPSVEQRGPEADWPASAAFGPTIVPVTAA